MKTLLTFVILATSTVVANAQMYARYPSQYGHGYYRAPYYGGGLRQQCAYIGCYAQNRYAQQAYRPAPRPSYNYDWSWGGGNRGYLGGRGGGWGGEW